MSSKHQPPYSIVFANYFPREVDSVHSNYKAALKRYDEIKDDDLNWGWRIIDGQGREVPDTRPL